MLLLFLPHLFVSPALGMTYSYLPGFLAAGYDLPSPGPVTYAQALSYCDSNLECMGFTYSSNVTQPTTPLDMYFKTAVNFEASPGWSTYIKSPPPEWPDKNITVGGGLVLGLRAASHTVSTLGFSNPTRDWSSWRNFSWVPAIQKRALPGCHNFGDVTLRTQPLAETNATAWTYFSSSWGGGSGITAIPLPADGTRILAVDDITPLLNATPVELRGSPAFGATLPLRVTRSYEAAPDSTGSDGAFVVRVNITALEDTRLGGFGFSQISDEFIGGDLDTIARVNSLIDPHIGGDHGYTEWVRMTGNESLLATPATPATTFQAWRPLMEDCNYGGWEHEWVVLSAAWAHAGEWGTQRQAPGQMAMAPDLVATGIWGPDPLTPIPAWRGGQVMNLSGMESRYFLPPTSKELRAGESVSFALRYALAPNGPRTAAQGLVAAGQPALRGVPGFTLGCDSNSSYLLITLPTAAGAPSGVSVTPPGILAFPSTPPELVSNVGGVSVYRAQALPLSPGRARAAVLLKDGSTASAHYHITPPFAAQVAAVGHHWAEQAWLPRDYPDPFGRSASVMPWDREDGVHVLDDSRAYIVGLSDDAGAAQHLGFSSKVGMAPTASEVARLDEYIDNTLYGVKPDVAKPPLRSLQTLPDSPEGPDHIRMTVYYYCDALPHCTSANGHFNYSYPMQDHCVRKRHSPLAAAGRTALWGLARFKWLHTHTHTIPPPPLFFSRRPNCRFPPHLTPFSPITQLAPVGGPNWCMEEPMANATYRGYNYPHSTSVWLAQYRVARNWDVLGQGMSRHWSQYLARAVALALNVGQASVGFMDGTVFRELLNVLIVEAEADAGNATLSGWRDSVEGNMAGRAKAWSTADWPYGSEFAYDTTGQEEVYVWLSYFANNGTNEGYRAAANRTLEATLGYMRHLPNAWWHGGGRSGGDLGNNGKWYVNRGGERLLQHYRAGLNSIPIIEAFRADPSDVFLLHTAMGAMTGGYGSILPASHPTSPGAVSMGFHTVPFGLEYDPRSGDFGLGFFGVTLEAGAYLVRDEALPGGWACYMCNIGGGGSATTTPTTTSVSLAPIDGYRVRVYLEPIGVFLTAETGAFQAVALDLVAHTATITFEPALVAPAAPTPHATKPFSALRLKVSKEAQGRPGGGFTVKLAGGGSASMVRGAFSFPSAPADTDTTTVVLSWV